MAQARPNWPRVQQTTDGALQAINEGARHIKIMIRKLSVAFLSVRASIAAQREQFERDLDLAKEAVIVEQNPKLLQKTTVKCVSEKLTKGMDPCLKI